MFEHVRPKRYKLDPVTLSLGQIAGERFNQLKLDKLPVHNEFGIGLVTKIELYCTMTIGTTNGDPAIPAYMLHRLLDAKVFGGDNFPLVDRLGWHTPVREYLKYGRFVGATPADIAGGATTTWTRVLTVQMQFDEPTMGPHRFWRCLPTTWFRTGRIEVNPHTAIQAVNGANPKLTDIVITPYVEIADFPLSAVPIGSIVQETFKSGDKDASPTPGAGQYLRCSAVLDPATGTFKDDLSTLTTIMFGKEGSGGFTVPRYTDVTEHMRTWNDKYSQDPKALPGIGITSEFFRFLDPSQNASARLHAIPLAWPKYGQGPLQAPDWPVVNPELNINNTNRAGTPTTIDFLADKIVDRDAAQLGVLLEGIRRGGLSRFRGNEQHALVKGTGKPQRMPLLVDLS